MTYFVSLVIPNLYLHQLQLFFDNNWQFISSDVINGKIELIVVTSALLKAEVKPWINKYPLTKFLIIKQNKGFAATVNTGFRTALGTWLGTVNDDVTLSLNWLDKLLSVAHDHTGSINPIIRDLQGKIESAGIKILDRGKAQPISQVSENKITYVDATNGACVLYRKQALDQVGLFDERFGSYLEDIDLSLRLKRAGWQNMVNHQVTVTHQQQASSKTLGWHKNWLDTKNWWLVILKNWTVGQWIKYWPIILLERFRNLSGLIKQFIKSSSFHIIRK